MNTLIFTTILLALVGVPCLIWTTGNEYSGKEVFRSHEEYIEFKEAIAVPGVNLESMAIASSEPPIVVQFKVNMPRGTGFDYGKSRWVDSTTGRIVFTSLFVPLLLLAAVAWLPIKENR